MLTLLTRVVTETYEDRPTSPALPASERRTYIYHFTQRGLVEIPGSVHGLATADLVVAVYAEHDTKLHAITAEVETDLVTYDVTITLLQPMTGRVVLQS